MIRFFTLLSVLLILAACGGDADPSANEAVSDNRIIQWDRDPQTIVFRADIVGGDNERIFRGRNEVPQCTIYGDNRIVWTNELGDFDVQVLWDQLTDQQIQDFIAYLTVTLRIYTYDAKANLQRGATAPVVETIWVSVNGRDHVTDAFAGWDQEFFQEIVEACKDISQAPVLFVPTQAWLTVRPTDYNPNFPSVLWNEETTGLSLGELANEASHWITDGDNVGAMWSILRTSSPFVWFRGETGTFQVLLEVPGVTRDSPPPPEPLGES